LPTLEPRRVPEIAGDCSVARLASALMEGQDPCLGMRLVGHCVAYRALRYAGIEPPRGQLLSTAITEPTGGSSLKAATTLARDAVTGEKIFATNGTDADAYMVYATTINGEPAVVLVPRSPMTRAEPMKLTAYTCAGIALLRLDNAPIAAASTGPKARHAVHRALIENRVLVAALATGLAKQALAVAIDWAKKRGLQDRQAVTHRIAHAWAMLRAAEALATQAAQAAETGTLQPHESSAAKYAAVEAALEAARAARRTLAGHAFTQDSPVAALQQHIEALEPAEGTQDIQLEIIARKILKS
jgi:alkylation response protein AidB-like acyl-CoA dehydrogenase